MSQANANSAPREDVVIDVAKTRISDLWKKEDYWAIWLGFLILVFGMMVFFNSAPQNMESEIAEANATMAREEAEAPFRTVEWFQAASEKNALKAGSDGFGKFLGVFTKRTHSWSGNPIHAFMKGPEDARKKNEAGAGAYEAAQANVAAALETARASQAAAAAAGYSDTALNEKAKDDIAAWQAAKGKASSAEKKATATPYNQIGYMIGLGLVLALLFGTGMKVMGNSFSGFAKGFVVVFLLAILAFFFSSQATAKAYGIGYAAWAIAIGLLISNTVGTPEWVKPGVQTEYYIKTGLVLLGAEILLSKILSIGVPGIFVAWVVTPIVLVSTFIFGQKVLKIESKTMNMVISADMSVCGVSAAIATASACRAKKEELTLAVGLSLVFTSIMMIVMPAFIKAVGIPEVLGGAWMGGTIDATGAVAAAGAFLGERALYTAATIKMIQNVLIGVIAFAVAVYWCAKVECEPGQKVGAMEIWHRFPKFVIGFIGASVIFSSIYASLGPDAGYTLIDQGVLKGLSKNLRGWFFCLAFVSIGLATDFRELKGYFKGGKPLILYFCGQSFNLILTLTMAYIMFYKVFPEITARI
ncbi:MAG: YeiH family protein [Desulfococcaceae bacterium]